MRFHVVSDLHIKGSDDPIYRSLLWLIRERARPGDVLVLAGDLFDLFVGGKKIFLKRYHDFFVALRDAGARGTRIHFIEGNHDFLIKHAFHGVHNLTLHSHHVSLEEGDKRFFIAHGDTADIKDYKYRALRIFFRSPIMRTFVTLAPGRLIDMIGQWSSQHSRGLKPLLFERLSIKHMERLRKTFRSYAAEKLTEGYDYVILGHCHDLDEMKFKFGNKLGQYVNVGYPRVHQSYLEWSPGDPYIQRTILPVL
jgi:UDP-2,3-diacylglucosamine hydrolase